MSTFVPNKVYLRGILLHYFIQKKSAAEAHRILAETYGENALSDTTCRDWFRCSKNNDFELEDKERSGAPKKFEDEKLEELLNQDRCQTLRKLGKTLQVVTLIHGYSQPQRNHQYIVYLLDSFRMSRGEGIEEAASNDNLTDDDEDDDSNRPYQGWLNDKNSNDRDDDYGD
ncbi:Mariner Mos1 transposase [Eumeta japonica]|uniref:Mariner Mos1 transposase n=1 Tax=Eumeta variegata TaxID=151549 RepID=A0A4C1U8P4_EUMVA|nr:Mariner Mos1 transposase [Eumeta japonica]